MLTPGYPSIVSVVLEDIGHWNIYATVPGIGAQQTKTYDITIVRGTVTVIDEITFTDPFGPALAKLTFPALTLLDSLGEGDLHWWRPGALIDIVWTFNDQQYAATPDDVVRHSLRWEGYLSGDSVSFADSGGIIQMTCKGALRRMDNTLAMPIYPSRPIPYEHAIKVGIEECNLRGAGLGRLKVVWPKWWDVIYKDDPKRIAEMHPIAVEDGDKWSGMITRNTGNRQPMLTGYIQGLLGSMHTTRGQFTLMLDRGRVPVLRHRDRLGIEALCEIDLVTPGVTAELSNDYEAKANVVYGTGSGLDGVSFSNMQFTGSLGHAYYLPFAAHHSVYPFGAENPNRDPRTITREISLTFYDGMSAAEAQVEANSYIRRFAVAGSTGQMTLTTDPYAVRNNRRVTMLRHTLMAGDSIRLVGAHGRKAGSVLHITESTYSPANGTLTLKVDELFRDHLTSQEVNLRGRDALTNNRLLTLGSFSPTIKDQMLPWNEKSGFAPVTSYDTFGAARVELGEKSMIFPWETMAKRYPPKDPKYRQAYIRIPPADPKVMQNNWSRSDTKKPSTMIWLSQSGQIGLMQFMAVDAEGNRMQVPFHLSIYWNEEVDGSYMPKMDHARNEDGSEFFHPLFPTVKTGYYPFFPGAWENINPDGTAPTDTQQRHPSEGSAPLVMLGGYKSAAGYYPSSEGTGYPPTGLLNIENPFGYDVGTTDKDWNPNEKRNSFEGAAATGVAALLIYCDSMWDAATSMLVPRNKDVYFIGRLFRIPPGTAA